MNYSGLQVHEVHHNKTSPRQVLQRREPPQRTGSPAPLRDLGEGRY